MLRDRPKAHSQIVFELNILMQLQNKDTGIGSRIIRYVDNFTFRGFFCIVMELLFLDIYTVLKNQRFAAFPITTVQIAGRETAEALQYIHSRGLIHCDIKPENILFTDKTKRHVKVIDYGCSCFIGKILFSYIQSRYYRAPEVVLGLQYGPEIDIWSLACVLSEMLTGRPLFNAEEEDELIDMMVQLRGLPPLNFLKVSPRAHHYFDETGQLKPKTNGKSIVPGSLSMSDATKVNDPDFLDLMERSLKWVPAERLTARQFVEHVWVKKNR
jgi:dual specificity tyrosine-phosphorylation-regulated kinase 2/3/4